MSIPNKRKNIYCIEGLWNRRNIRDKSTVLPILELLEKGGYCDYIYNDSATKDELEFFLSKWKNTSINKKYPILYLAFHGEKGCVFLTQKEKYSLEDLADFLEDKCRGTIIYFGSCSTLNLDKRVIKTFLKRTGSIAAIGYKIDLDWIQSAACDLLVFEALQYDKLDTKGINKIYKTIKSDYGNLHKILHLNVVINDNQHFPRRRVSNWMH